MARLRITVEDDRGREIHGDKARLDDWSGGAKRFGAIAAAGERLTQAA